MTNTVPRGSILMRARSQSSYSSFLSIFETDVYLSKCGHVHGKAADEPVEPNSLLHIIYLFVAQGRMKQMFHRCYFYLVWSNI